MGFRARTTVFQTGGGSASNFTNAAITAYREFNQLVEAGLRDVLFRVGETIVERTFPFVPKDTEALVQSSQFGVVKGEKGTRVQISYGGATRTGATPNAPTGFVDYAVEVHEGIPTIVAPEDRIRFPGQISEHNPPEGARFLERGARAAQSEVNLLIERALASIAK